MAINLLLFFILRPAFFLITTTVKKIALLAANSKTEIFWTVTKGSALCT